MRSVRFVLLVLAFLTGAYGWFLGRIPTSVADATRQTDGIVVNTGGALRLDEAGLLLAQGRARRLLISGVSTDNLPEDVLTLLPGLPRELFECCVDLGYQARNTIGNADETAAWARERGMRTLRVVTAAYHMPRSLVELRRALPDVELVPHPVFPERVFDNGTLPPVTAPLEFGKYTLALIRLRLSDIEPRSDDSVISPLPAAPSNSSPAPEPAQ